MKIKMKWRAALFALLSALLLVAAGCQSVGGFEMDKVLLGPKDLQSSEGKATVKVQLMTDPAKASGASDAEKAMLKLLDQAVIEISDIKEQDDKTMSAKGSVNLAKGAIPFQLAVTKDSTTIKVDGTDKPIVLDSALGIGSSAKLPIVNIALGDVLKQLDRKSLHSILGTALSFVSNPGKVDVASATENINGEQAKLYKVHTELDGKEMLAIAKSFLKSISTSSPELNKAVGQLYDVLYPAIKPMLQQDGKQSSALDLSVMLGNKNLVVGILAKYISDWASEQLKTFDSSAIATTYFTAGSSLNADLYVDESFALRKSHVEATIGTKGDSAAKFITGVKFTVDTETWNINQPVNADSIETGGQPLKFDSGFKPVKLLSVLDKKSVLYDVMMNDLDVTRKNFQVVLNDEQVQKGAVPTEPYRRGGTTLVPTRFITENLDADVEWNGELKKVTVTDIMTGNKLEFTIGDKQAYVNGKVVTLDVAPELHAGKSFVPIRFIVEQLGGKVAWNGENASFTITKD